MENLVPCCECHSPATSVSNREIPIKWVAQCTGCENHTMLHDTEKAARDAWNDWHRPSMTPSQTPSQPGALLPTCPPVPTVTGLTAKEAAALNRVGQFLEEQDKRGGPDIPTKDCVAIEVVYDACRRLSASTAGTGIKLRGQYFSPYQIMRDGDNYMVLRLIKVEDTLPLKPHWSTIVSGLCKNAAQMVCDELLRATSPTPTKDQA